MKQRHILSQVFILLLDLIWYWVCIKLNNIAQLPLKDSSKPRKFKYTLSFSFPRIFWQHNVYGIRGNISTTSRQLEKIYKEQNNSCALQADWLYHSLGIPSPLCVSTSSSIKWEEEYLPQKFILGWNKLTHECASNNLVAEQREIWIGRVQMIFRAMKIFCDTLMMGTCHYTFVKTQKCTTPRVSPPISVDFGWLWRVSVGLSVVTIIPLCG